MVIKHIIALGRPLVVSRITNRLIVIFTLAVLTVTLVFQLILKVPSLEALGTAAAAAFAVFLTWAISREIDPANDWSAFIALPAALVIALVFGAPSFAALFFILLLSRVLNGSPGKQITIADSILLIALGAILFYDGTFIALLILALVFFLDAFIEPPNRKQSIFAAISLAVFVVMFLIIPEIPLSLQAGSIYSIAGLLLVAAAVVILVMLAGHEQVADDENRSTLQKHRVCLARVLPAVFIMVEVILKGEQALLLLYPAGLAYCGAALYHLARLFKAGRIAGG